MLDFWTVTGAMVADSRLIDHLKLELNKIQNGPDGDPFRRVGLRAQWNDYDADSAVTTAVVFNEKIVRMQEAIDAFFRGYAPYDSWQMPISLYCAAAVCRLELAGRPQRGYSFMTTLGNVGASDKGKAFPKDTPGKVALLGLLQVDTASREMFTSPTGDPQSVLRPLYVELTPDELQRAKELAVFIEENAYEYDAHRNDDWIVGCFNVLRYYDAFDRAIR